ncbi:RHS repeat-associated core domain-containing protein [Paraglaciecola sp. MB-3u-78]|uniref:RHS repeat-associated core domain-containing protein n=1 Tax=Paraglaciecola sp. MB-3u-78 TaxID=2058332 RepID=UPI0021077947|nr:RHS repeat-associated core domain-containing protein [Paraglaciecola sp. MB-3u-78]
MGLTYMQARYYDPVIGRFYSNDPIGFRDVHSFNRYAYANNNPYKYIDPDGRETRLMVEAHHLDMDVVNGNMTAGDRLEISGAQAVGAAIGTVAAAGATACAASGACAAAVTTAAATQVGSSIKTDGSTTASSIKAKAESVGFKPSQSANGPLKMVDENGKARVTIKGGSQRAPRSDGPHVELKDSSGQRVNPAGQPVTRNNPENHTPIENDL